MRILINSFKLNYVKSSNNKHCGIQFELVQSNIKKINNLIKL